MDELGLSEALALATGWILLAIVQWLGRGRHGGFWGLLGLVRGRAGTFAAVTDKDACKRVLALAKQHEGHDGELAQKVTDGVRSLYHHHRTEELDDELNL